ncbi:MAG TPA: DUF945 family protein [Candidatus Binataceae bacterium]
MFASRTGSARAAARTAYLVVAAACLATAIVIPALFGARAERIYRESVAQLGTTGRVFRLESYRRGWFSSQAVVSVTAGRGAITFVQHVHHGPLGFYNGWHVAFPVAAVVDTEPPSALKNNLDRFFGEAPIYISTVVEMDGTLDTYVSRAATVRSAAAQKFTARFDGFDLEVHLSKDAYVIRGDAPGVMAAGGFGEAGIAGLTIRGESHRHPSGLWLGDKVLKISRVNYSIVAAGARPSASGLINDIALAGQSRIGAGHLNVRDTLSVGTIAAGAVRLGAMSLGFEFSNLPVDAIQRFVDALSSIPPSAPGQQTQQSPIVKRQILELLVAAIKESPILSIDLYAASAAGEARGKARFGISADLANDPMLNNLLSQGKGLVAQAWNKYGRASAELIAPAGLLAQITRPEQLKQLEQSGILIRDRANYVCRAAFKDGRWLVNGHEMKFPAPPSRPNLTSRSS